MDNKNETFNLSLQTEHGFLSSTFAILIKKKIIGFLMIPYCIYEGFFSEGLGKGWELSYASVKKGVCCYILVVIFKPTTCFFTECYWGSNLLTCYERNTQHRIQLNTY